MQNKIVSLVAAGIILLAQPAFAENIVGTVQSVDADNTVLTLEDGTTFNIPEEYDLTGIEPGTPVDIEYDVTDGQNTITDLFIPD